MRIVKTSILFLTLAACFFVFPCHAGDRWAYTGTETLIKTVSGPEAFKFLPDGSIKLRNWEGIYYYTSSDDHMNGQYFRVIAHANLDASWSGNMWGTFFSVDATGNPVEDGWEGTLNVEVFSLLGFNWFGKALGHGIGVNTGLKFEDITVYGGDSPAGTIVGVIKTTDKE